MHKLIHSYDDLSGGEWLRGNLHTHTRQSDGSASPQNVIDDYAGRGYDFLMFSDHDVLTSDETYRQWESRGLVLIPGNELGGGSHLLHVDAVRQVYSRSSRQEIINEINAIAAETGRGFALVNHPNWQGQFDHATLCQMREWTGYLGLEIYNGVIGPLDGSPYATNKWDMLLTEGRRLWGFANDDCHWPGTVGLGWNVAYAKERSVAGVIEALRSGRFFASTGVTITKIEVEGMTIRLETEDAHRICALRDVGKRFAYTDDRVIEVCVPDDAKYVRFECWGVGERFAWTQPFFVKAEAAGPEAVALSFVPDWEVSRLLEHGALESASPEEAGGEAVTPLHAYPAGHAAPGFVNVAEISGGEAGLVYMHAAVEADRDVRGVLKLGFDGPVRVWVNDREVFSGPGTNPAVPDEVSVYAPFKRGTNRVLVALDTHGGKARGIFCRADL